MTAGQEADCSIYDALMEARDSDPAIMLGDKGYDSDPIRREQTMQPGMTVSAVARLHGVSPSLLFQWRRRMAEGGHEAVRADEEVVPVSRVRELENRIRELERLLGRKTMETEILREALEQGKRALTTAALSG